MRTQSKVAFLYKTLEKNIETLELIIYEVKNCKDALERRTLLCENYFVLERKKSRKMSDESYVTLDSKLTRLKSKIEDLSEILQKEVDVFIKQIKHELNEWYEKYDIDEKMYSKIKCMNFN